MFGLRILLGQPWVDIADDARDARYLFSAPLCLFEITDDRVPALWVARIKADGQLRLAPPSMLAEYYFDDLFEEKRAIVDDFAKLRRQLEEGSAKSPR